MKKVAIASFTVLFLSASSCTAWAETKFVTEEVVLPPLEGPKKTIAVLGFENKSNFAAQVAIGGDFSEMLTEALMKSGRFIVVARQELDAVIAEQDMAATGRFAKSETAVKGKLVPAQIIIKGALTEFEARTSGGAGGVTVGNFGFGDIGLSGQAEHAHVGVIIYIIDTSTGELLDSQRVEGKAKSHGFGIDYAFDNNFSIGTSDFKRTPLGKATQMTISKAVEYIASRLADIPWSGSIAKVDGDTAFLNAGSDAGIVNGDTFTVYREEEALTDPVTGASLGAERSRIADINVFEVKEKYSKARIENASAPVARGDLVLE